MTFLNQGVTPVVPEKGSVGASGDLAPAAHMGLLLIGRGEAFFKGQRLPGDRVLREIGLKPLKPGAGEGLALINGTQTMTAIGVLVVEDAVRLSKTADIACAMTLEVLMGSNSEFDPRIHLVRPHPGQIATADNMLRLTAGSQIVASHAGCARIQDAYTLRCSPQIHGASKDAVAHAMRVIDIEINSSTTNPLIFADTEEVRLGGNFHGPARGHGGRLPLHGTGGAGKCFRKKNRAAGQSPAQRTARLSGEKRGTRFRVDDRPVRGGRAGFGKQGPGPSGLRGFHPDFGQQGGPREHGNHRHAPDPAKSWKTWKTWRPSSFSAPPRPTI